jgi:hypothetical protein
MNISLDEFKSRAAHALAEITPPLEDERPTHWEVRRLDFEEFPIPDLVLFALTRLRGLKALGPGEKIAWSINAQFRNVPLEIALRKFGFQVIYPKGTPCDVVDALVKCLKKAAHLAAKSLAQFAQHQIDRGDVSIDNQYRIFDGAYRFFREEGEERFKDTPTNGIAVMLSPRFAEAGYCAGAMVNAYFSRLEHVLVLAIAFTDFEPGNGALRKLAESTWDKKLGDVFDLETDGVAKRLRDLLGKVKKQFRNPIAHGGFDKRGTLFYFHVSGIAAMPALLSDYKVSIERYVTPITELEFAELCTQLDECDHLLESTHLGVGVRFARRCLPVSFSESKRKKYREIAAHPEKFEDFFDRETDLIDMQANMDY